jgi:hypothetical protein
MIRQQVRVTSLTCSITTRSPSLSGRCINWPQSLPQADTSCITNQKIGGLWKLCSKYARTNIKYNFLSDRVADVGMWMSLSANRPTDAYQSSNICSIFVCLTSVNHRYRYNNITILYICVCVCMVLRTRLAVKFLWDRPCTTGTWCER